MIGWVQFARGGRYIATWEYRPGLDIDAAVHEAERATRQLGLEPTSKRLDATARVHLDATAARDGRAWVPSDAGVVRLTELMAAAPEVPALPQTATTGAWYTPSSVTEDKRRLNDRIATYGPRIASASIDEGTRNAWKEWHREWLEFYDVQPGWSDIGEHARKVARFRSELTAWDELLEQHPPRAPTTAGSARFDTRGLDEAVHALADQWLGLHGVVCVADYRDDRGAPRGVLVDVQGDSTRADRELPSDVLGGGTRWPVFLRQVERAPRARERPPFSQSARTVSCECDHPAGPLVDRMTTTGAGPSVVCTRLEPQADKYRVRQGRRYRALVSVGRTFETAAVAKYLGSNGWSDVKLYEAGDPLPADWPTGEHMTSLEAGHRWLRGEAIHTRVDEDLDVSSTLHQIVELRLSIYRIADLWECVGAPDDGARPHPTSAAPPTPSAAASSVAAEPMVTIYGTSWCKACGTASAWLTAHQIPFVEYNVEEDPFARKELARRLAEAKRADPGVVPIIDVLRSRLLVGWDPDVVQAAIAARGAPIELLHMGPGPGPGGLDASISPELARTVEEAWALETDPAKVRGLAATMRQGGYPLAGSVLDQRALNVEAESAAGQVTHLAEERERRANQGLKVAGVIASFLGLFVALAKH
jgi:hypothetical protein